MLSNQDVRTLREMAHWYRQQRALRVTRKDFQPAKVISSDTSLFRVDMELTGGDDGDETMQATWVYNILRNGQLLEANLNLDTGSRHDYKRQGLGEITPATSGLAYYNTDSELIIYHCNEDDLVEACDTDDGGGVPADPFEPFVPVESSFSNSAARFIDTQLVRSAGASLLTPSNIVLSIGGWIKVNDVSQLANTYDFLFGVASPSVTNKMYRLAAYHNGDTTYNLRLTHANSSFAHYDDTTVLNTGTWYRVWMVVAGAADRKIYIDDVNTFTSTASRAQSTCVDFGIAAAIDSTPNYSQSVTLFDVQYYDAALTVDDISYDYSNPQSYAHNRIGTSLASTDLVLSWPCNDGTGLTFEDISGNANHGTATGVEWDDSQNQTTGPRS